MNDAIEKEGLDESLFGLFKVKSSEYAVQSSYIESLFLMEQELTPMPDSADCMLGVIQYRNSVLPILDLRQMLGMESVAQEEKEFELMLEQRKQDHIHWVDELKRCLKAKETFTLATDPHQCAFGKWYYSYKPQSQSVQFHLNKIEEPHASLHKTALEAFACERHCDDCTREECLQKAVKRGTETYMPQVLELLEEAKRVFKENYRRMVVVVSDGKNNCGILVDEVSSVETLNMMKDYGEFTPEGERRLITNVAHRENSDKLVLILSGQKLVDSRPSTAQQ